MTHFHPLVVKEVRRETNDCVSIAFDIPASLKTEYSFAAGQNVTVKTILDGEEVRRSYSICSSPAEEELRIAVKRIADGRFSGHANLALQKGDVVEVMPPTGRFTVPADAATALHYLAFAAGSGITPVISIIKTILSTVPCSRFTLVYGNRDRHQIIFLEQLEALKNRYMDRFVLHHVLSREESESPAGEGRINKDKCDQLSGHLFDIGQTDHVFLCGPSAMISTVREWLEAQRSFSGKVHYELFHVPVNAEKNNAGTKKQQENRISTITVKLDGNRFNFPLPFDGPSLLDGALQLGADLPFACKGGVCATCRARLISGEVSMDRNYALEQDELDQGFILTCQSHPLTPAVEIDFDAK